MTAKARSLSRAQHNNGMGNTVVGWVRGVLRNHALIRTHPAAFVNT